MNFEIINQKDIPIDIDISKQYNTKLIGGEWVNGDLVIRLEFINEEYSDSDPQCVFPLTINSDFFDIDHHFMD